MAPRLERGGDGAGPLVEGYRDGGFVVEERSYRSVWLTPEAAGEWEPPAIAELTPEHLAAPLALEPAPEFLLLGTGERLARPPSALIAALEERGIGVEAMDSRAAARAWSLLRAEERWIAAALMPL